MYRTYGCTVLAEIAVRCTSFPYIYCRTFISHFIFITSVPFYKYLSRSLGQRDVRNYRYATAGQFSTLTAEQCEVYYELCRIKCRTFCFILFNLSFLSCSVSFCLFLDSCCFILFNLNSFSCSVSFCLFLDEFPFCLFNLSVLSGPEL